MNGNDGNQTHSLSSIDGLERIFATEHENYKLKDHKSTLRAKIEEKNQIISSLQAEVASVKKQLGEKEQELYNYENENNGFSVGQIYLVSHVCIAVSSSSYFKIHIMSIFFHESNIKSNVVYISLCFFF